MRLMWALLLTFSSSSALAENSTQKVKEQIIEVDHAERQLLGTLFSINERMKDMSKKRDRLTDRRLVAEGDAHLLARNIVQIEGRLTVQKKALSRRIRALYLLNGQAAMRTLFSSQSSVEFDRNLRFLKLITDRDYSLIKDYDRSLRELRKKRKELEHQVRRIASIQNALKDQEKRLAKEQAGKSELLGQLKMTREHRMNELQDLRRNQEGDSELDTAFFEKRGNLNPPVAGELIKTFGYIQDEVLRFRLGHKGHFYRASRDENVNSVFGGRTEFAGSLPGYGLTAIIDHGDHYYSVYSHLTKLKVQVGDKVTEGQVVGNGGGVSPWFGNGVYFEIRHFSDAIDPQPWLNKMSGGRQNENSRQSI